MIMHIDMDAFFASVEQAINPSLKGKPLIVGSRANKYHTVVCAASYEAKRLGIDSGMSTKEAFKICPHALFVATDSAKYVYVSQQIFAMLKDYSPKVDYSSVDEFDLDFTDSKIHCLNIAKAIKEKIKDTFKITCSIGIAPNWYLAKLGSKIEKPDGLTYIDTNNYLDLLKDMSVYKICGIGPALTSHLSAMGIKTCGQLLKHPKQLLIQKFGKIGSWMHDCLNPNCYVDASNTNNPILPKSIGHSYTLPRETSDTRMIRGWLRMLSEMVADRLRKLELDTKTLCLWTSNMTQKSLSKRRTFDDRFWLGEDIFMRSLAILGLKKGQRMAIRALGISASSLSKKLQIPLLKEEQKRELLGQKIGQINERFGSWTIYPATIALIHKEDKPKGKFRQERVIKSKFSR